MQAIKKWDLKIEELPPICYDCSFLFFSTLFTCGSLIPLTLFSPFYQNALRLNAASIAMRHAWLRSSFLMGVIFTSCVVSYTALFPLLSHSQPFSLYPSQSFRWEHCLVCALGTHLYKATTSPVLLSNFNLLDSPLSWDPSESLHYSWVCAPL